MERDKHWSKMSKEELQKYLFDKGIERKDYSKQAFSYRKVKLQPRKPHSKPRPSVKTKKISYKIIVNKVARNAKIVFESQCFDSSNVENLYNSISRNKLEQFLLHFGQLIIDYPNNADLYYFRGLAHSRIGNLKQSVSDFQHALRAAPKHVFAIRKLEKMVSQMKEIEKQQQKLRVGGTGSFYTSGREAVGDDPG